VDDDDGDPDLLPYLHGLTPDQAQERFRLGGSPTGTTGEESPGADSGPPAIAYWVAAIRETFEETGILLMYGGSAGLEGSAASQARARLLDGGYPFRKVMEGLGVTLDADSLAYVGHWLTPECEPRRYETRFFVAEVEPGVVVRPYKKEMVDATWITPKEALTRNQDGGFPLVFPTLFTLEELRRFQTPEEAMALLRGRPVPRRLPRPERAEGGVLFKLAE
jgi:8-oxo-dGTP pyrophosphatase MutT (NUDIX family)